MLLRRRDFVFAASATVTLGMSIFPVGVEMHDEFVPVPTNLFGEVREVGFHHFQANKKAGLEGSGISDDVTLEMFVLFVA